MTAPSRANPSPAQVFGSASRWAELHDESSVLAQAAWMAGRDGDPVRARSLYLEAGAKEVDAYAALPVDVSRSRGILAVSLVSLLAKGGDELAARSRVTTLLRDPELPAWAAVQLRSMFAEGGESPSGAKEDHGDRPKGHLGLEEKGTCE